MQRGRKSAASLGLVAIGTRERMPPPDILSPEQADLWTKITHTKPADWFDEDSAPLLVEYIRAITECNRLAWVIDQLRSEDFDGYKVAMKLRNQEANRAAQMATKLRLTLQSRILPRKAGGIHEGAATKGKLWDRQQES